MSGVHADLRSAARLLIRHRGFAAVAVITLALCIGANTAIFSMLYALVIKPLPFRTPDRLVEVYNSFPKAGLDRTPSNIAQYLDFTEHADAFERLALWQFGELTWGEDVPSRVTGVTATAEMFDVLGVQPLLGRFFTAANHEPSASKVLVLTESFWAAQFQRDAGVLGRTVRLDGEAYEVVGVAPHVFEAFEARAKFVRPMSWPSGNVAQFSRYGVSPSLYGRLRPSASVATALAQVTALERQYYDSAPPDLRGFLDRSGHAIGVEGLQAQRVRPVQAALYLLQGGVLFVLLIGCVNVANFLLARANARQGELATRVALGAGRAIIARQLLVESTLLAWIGAALGLGLAWVALGAANAFTSQLLPNALPFAIDGRVLAYTAVIAGLTSLAIGILPVVHVLSGNLLRVMQSQSRGASTGRRARAMSTALVVAQIAFTLVLLTGAGLLMRGFVRAMAVDPGFDPRQVVTARVALSADYRRDNGSLAFQQRLLESLQEMPGATVSLATATPFLTGMGINAFTLRDYTLPEGAAQPGAFHFGASPAYLDTMGIPLLEGRWFNESDTNQSRRVYVVDEDFARRYFPGESAVGRHLTFGGPPPRPEDWPEIVGVVGTVLNNGIEEASGNPYLYHPLTQTPFGTVSLFVRSARPAAEVIASVRARVAAVDPALPVFQAEPMDAVISAQLDNRRAIMLLLGSFAGVALLLSAIGIYGVLAYDVSQRTREIGIRGAIGATRGQVVGLILRQGLWKTTAGLVAGLAVAIWMSRYMSSLLFEVTPTDPFTYAMVSAGLFVVALLASYLPAWRAARIEPTVALRSE